MQSALNELIDHVVEYCLTHVENYSTERTDGAIKLSDDSPYWLTVVPDRVNPGELLASSGDHRRKRIEAWQKFARAEFGS